MANLLSIKNQINRYQTSDPVLFDILSGIVSELSAVSSTSTVESLPNAFIKGFRKLTYINNAAVDFTANNGDAWNVIGVATPFRAFCVSEDNKLMFYTMDVEGSTIVAGIATQLNIALPPGYICAGNIAVASGWGYLQHVAGGLFENLIVDCPGGTGFVRLFRQAFAAYPISAANMYTRVSILLPVEKQSGIIPK